MSPASHQPYFYTQPNLISDDRVLLPPAEARHLDVRRAGIGDLVTVGDGAGTVVQARLSEVDGTRVCGAIVDRRYEDPPAVAISIFQGLAKGAKVDWVVEKLVELGVDEIAVFSAGRSVPIWDGEKGRRMHERWRRIAVAASKQSHRAWIPAVRGPWDRDEAISAVSGLPLALIGDPGAQTSVRQALPGTMPAAVGVVVGPEGGLSDPEVEAFREAGATAVGLGPQVLRTETAALVICSVLLYELGRLGGR